jgi:competence protein ComEC
MATAEFDDAEARSAGPLAFGRPWRWWLSAALEELRTQADRWFLWSPAMFGAGALAYFTLRREPPLWLVIAAAATAIALAAWARARASRSIATLSFLTAFLACGFAGGALRTWLVQAPVIRGQAMGGVEGWVIDVAGPGSGGGGRLLIAPYRIDGVADEALPARIRVTVSPSSLIGPGEAVRLRALLNGPPGPASPGAYDFARDSFFQRIGGVGFSLSDPAIISGRAAPWGLRALMAVNAARWSLARRIIDDMGVERGGVAVAMTTGHEAWLDPDQVQAMRDAGLSHILSISGVHMAIVGGFVFLALRLLIAAWPWLVLRVPGKKLAALGGLIATGLYLVVSGAPAPAVRSAVTLAVAFCAILADRRPISLHALALAALIVLALQPEAIVQPGFQMSFAATLALVALAEALPRPPREINTPWPIRLVQRARTWIVAAVGLSLAASLATNSFAIQHFNRVSLWGMPANLLMEPLSTLVIMPALAGGALLECFGAGGWLLGFAGWGIGLLDQLARAVASWPKAVIVVASAPAVALPIAALGLMWLCLWRGRLRWLGLPAALAVMVWPRPEPPVAWIASDGGAAAIAIEDRALFLRPDAKQFAAQLWARRRGLTEPKDGEAQIAARFDCNRRRCLPLGPARPAIAAWWTRRVPTAAEMQDLCAGADLVILRGEGPLDDCPAPIVLTGETFAQGGAAEVYRAAHGWRMVWANQSRGVRPWTGR